MNDGHVRGDRWRSWECGRVISCCFYVVFFVKIVLIMRAQLILEGTYQCMIFFQERDILAG